MRVGGLVYVNSREKGNESWALMADGINHPLNAYGYELCSLVMKLEAAVLQFPLPYFTISQAHLKYSIRCHRAL